MNNQKNQNSGMTTAQWSCSEQNTSFRKFLETKEKEEIVTNQEILESTCLHLWFVGFFYQLCNKKSLWTFFAGQEAEVNPSP